MTNPPVLDDAFYTRFAGSERVRRPTVDPTARAVVVGESGCTTALMTITKSGRLCEKVLRACPKNLFEAVKPCVTTTIFFLLTDSQNYVILYNEVTRFVCVVLINAFHDNAGCEHKAHDMV